MEKNIFAAFGKNNSNVYLNVGAKVINIPNYLFHVNMNWHDNEKPNITHIVFMGENDVTIGLGAFTHCNNIDSVFKHQNQKFTITTYNDEFATYIYSETNPGESDKYWHYVDGVVTIW
jgi:hypothetical protein